MYEENLWIYYKLFKTMQMVNPCIIHYNYYYYQLYYYYDICGTAYL